MAPRRRPQQRDGGSRNEVDVPVSEAIVTRRPASKRVKSNEKSDVKKKTQPQQQQEGNATRSAKQRQCKVTVKMTSSSVEKDPSKKSIKQKTISKSTKKQVVFEEAVNNNNNLDNVGDEGVELKAMKTNKKSKIVRFDVESAETDDETSVMKQQSVKANAAQAKNKSNEADKKNNKATPKNTKRKASKISSNSTKLQEATETTKFETDVKEELKKGTKAKMARTTRKNARKANSSEEQEELIANNEQKSDDKVEAVKKAAKTRGKRIKKNKPETKSIAKGVKKDTDENVSESGIDIKQGRKNAKTKAAKTERNVPKVISNDTEMLEEIQTNVLEVVEETKQSKRNNNKTTAKGRANTKKKAPKVDLKAIEFEESTTSKSETGDKADSVENSNKAEEAITKITRPKRTTKPRESKLKKVDPKGKVTKKQIQQRQPAKRTQQTLAKALTTKKKDLIKQAQPTVENKRTSTRTRNKLVQNEADKRPTENDSIEETVNAGTVKKGRKTIKRTKVIASNTDVNAEDASSAISSKRLNVLDDDCKSAGQVMQTQTVHSSEDKNEKKQIEDSKINVKINDITSEDGRLQQSPKETPQIESMSLNFRSSKVDESCEKTCEEPLELHLVVPESSNCLPESTENYGKQDAESLDLHFDVRESPKRRSEVAESCEKQSEESLDLHLDVSESPKCWLEMAENCEEQGKESLDLHLDDICESSHEDDMELSHHTSTRVQPSNDIEMSRRNSHAEQEVPIDQKPIIDEINLPIAISVADAIDTDRMKVSPNCSARSFSNSDQLGNQTPIKSGVEEEWISDDEDNSDVNVVDHSSDANWNREMITDQNINGSFMSETNGTGMALESKIVTDDDETMNETEPLPTRGHIVNEQMIGSSDDSKKLLMNMNEKDEFMVKDSGIGENNAFEKQEETARRSLVADVGLHGEYGNGEQQTLMNNNAKDEKFESVTLNSMEISQEFLATHENASNRMQQMNGNEALELDDSITLAENTYENVKNQEHIPLTNENGTNDEGYEYDNKKRSLPMDEGDVEVFEECIDVLPLASNGSSSFATRLSANNNDNGAIGDVLLSVVHKIETPVTNVSIISENQQQLSHQQSLDGIKGDASDDLIAEQKHQLLDELQFDDEKSVQQDAKDHLAKNNADDFVRFENDGEIQRQTTNLQTDQNSNSVVKRSAIPSSIRSRFELQHQKFWDKAPTIQEHVDHIKQLHSKHQSEIPNIFQRLAQSKASGSKSSGIPRKCTSESDSSVPGQKAIAKPSIDRNIASQKASTSAKKPAVNRTLPTSATGSQPSRLPHPQVNVKSLTIQRAKEERLVNRSVQQPTSVPRSEPRLSKRLERLATPKQLAKPTTSSSGEDKTASTSGGRCTPGKHRQLLSYVDTTGMTDKQYAEAVKSGMVKPLNTSSSSRKSSLFRPDSTATTKTVMNK